MNVLPKPLITLIEELSRLPGVGPRTAERYAFGLLKADPSVSRKMATALESFHHHIDVCPKTFMLIEKGEDVSPLYSDQERDKQVVAVVEDALDVVAIEKTRQFKGTYHVLGGALSPIDGVGPEALKITELISRIAEDKVSEVIIATNATVEGESTALYLQKQLEGSEVMVTRLARGLPAGIDLEYADHITLSRALEGRQAI